MEKAAFARLVRFASGESEILRNKYVALGVFAILRKMKPMRQIEVAELLVATGNFSVPYTKALFAATQADMLMEPDKYKWTLVSVWVIAILVAAHVIRHW